MKKLFFSSMFFVLFLFVGCQENSVTNPVSPIEAQKANIAGISSTTGVIPLDGILKYPGPGNIHYSLKGSVSYNLEIIPGKYVPAGQSIISSAEKTSTTDPNSIDGSYYLRLTTFVDATIDNLDNTDKSESYISSRSVEYLYEPVDGYYSVQESYSVEGSFDKLWLVCRFLVKDHSVELDGRWLSFTSGTTGNFAAKPVTSVSSELTPE